MNRNAGLAVIGLDIAKNVFQAHAVDLESGEIERVKLKREKVVAFFANRAPSRVAMEACGGAHHWARVFLAQGHEVRLLPARQVRPFVQRNKTDAHDAQAIWVAAQQPQIRAVPVKSVPQQACLALHRMRAQLMKIRIMQTNALRGLLYEFGMVMPVGHRELLKRLPGEFARAQSEELMPEALIQTLREQFDRVQQLQVEIDRIDRRVLEMARSHTQMRTLMEIPGVGPLTASALVSTATDFASFDSARQFAAWLGLTPRQTGTGGRVRQLGLSKRGDTYVRTLLMHGARAIIAQSHRAGWIGRLLQRRPYNVVVAALANKLARTVWAVLAHGRTFDALRWNAVQATA